MADDDIGVYVDPTSGEAVPLADLDLADLGAITLDLAELADRLAAAKRAIAAEAAGRLDARNRRKDVAGDLELETNPPTTDDYRLDVLRDQLTGLVDGGLLDRTVLDAVIVYPQPSTPAPRVDKREVNKLKGHDNPRVQAALATARVRSTNTRTLTVKRLKQEKA